MENELQQLTDTIMKVLDRYEGLLSKDLPKEALEPHRHIIDGLLEKIKGTEIKAKVANPLPLRLGGQLPGPANPQNIAQKPQVLSGASDDTIKEPISPAENPVIPPAPDTQLRPIVTDVEVTAENIDTMADALTEQEDSLPEAEVQGMKDLK